MKDRFTRMQLSVNSPALGAYEITPSDTTDLPEAIRAVTVGGSGGYIAFIGRDRVSYVTGPLPIGTYALLAVRVLTTGTTATGLTGWS